MEPLTLASSKNDISLWVDCYDDLFSDFDLRPYTSRNISDDFLREVKKLSHESDMQVDDLVLYLPKNARNRDSEAIITRRLHNHFIKNLHFFQKKRKSERKKDLLLSLLGLSMMLTAGYISSSGSRTIWVHVLLVVFEPAGWFLVWINLEHLINSSRREKPELEFYLKLSKCKIVFSDR
ncbi:MAG: hypothetical protein JNL60_05260 [Bacteroidia bacterium]|nr:hypothetical protein [Bacteroidia bacterium]